MIYLDTTSAASWRHASGLARVSRRLLEELGEGARAARWPGMKTAPGRSDWLLTPELFSEAERPGITAFIDRRPCRFAAIYHDAIPIKHPSITWPKSVERHPGYMKLLSKFDRVWAVSAASREELLGFWRWQGLANTPQVEVLHLGADAGGTPRRRREPGGSVRRAPRLVCLGILEPRKNQSLMLDACMSLRQEGIDMELHLVGRVNPHFGRDLAARVGRLRRDWPGLHHHGQMGDAALTELIAGARATVFPSIAEGCGLPLLESLWLGVPCLSSDIPSVLENAAGGGCVVVAANDLEGWRRALRSVLTDDALHARLTLEASGRPLPTWAEAAAALRRVLG